MTSKYFDKKYLFIDAWHKYAPPDLPIPAPEFQFATYARRKFRYDWCFTEPRIAVEVDGGQWAYGGGRHAKDSDREKQNLATELGWLVLHYSPDMLTRDPLACIEQVVRTLENQR